MTEPVPPKTNVPTCHWLCADKNYDFCGLPARMVGKDSRTNYCLLHAARAPELVERLRPTKEVPHD